MQTDVAGVKVVADAGLDYLRGIAMRKYDLMRDDMARMKLPALRRVISMGVVRITLSHFCPKHQDARSRGFGRIEIRAVMQHLRAPAIISLTGQPVRPYWWADALALPEHFEEIVLDVRRHEGEPVVPFLSSSQALPGDPPLSPPPPASGAAAALRPVTAVWAGWASVRYDDRLALLKRAVRSGIATLAGALVRQMLDDFTLRNGLRVVLQARTLLPINGGEISESWEDLWFDAYTVLAVDLDAVGDVWVMVSPALYTSGHPLPSGQPQPNPAVVVINLSRIGDLSERNWLADEVAAARSLPNYTLRLPLGGGHDPAPWLDVDGVATLCPLMSTPGIPRDPAAVDQANLWRELSGPAGTPDALNVAKQWIWWLDNYDGVQGYAFFGLGGSRFCQVRVEFDPLPVAWWRELSFDWMTHQFAPVVREDLDWMHTQIAPPLEHPPERIAAEATVRNAFASRFGRLARGEPPRYPPGGTFRYAGKEHIVRPAERGSAGHYRHWHLAGEGIRVEQHLQDHDGWLWGDSDSRAYPVYRLLWRGEDAGADPIVLDEALGFSDVAPASPLVLAVYDDTPNNRTLMTFLPPFCAMGGILDSGQGAMASHCGVAAFADIPCFWPTETDVPWYSRRHAGLIDCAAAGRSLCIVRYSWLWEAVLRAAMIPVLYQEPEEARGNLWPVVPGRRSQWLDALEAQAAGNWNPFGLVGNDRRQFDDDHARARIRLAEFSPVYERLYADYLVKQGEYGFWRDRFANDNGNETARTEMEAARGRMRDSQAAMSAALTGFVRQFRRVLVNNCLTDQIIDWLEPGNAYFMY